MPITQRPRPSAAPPDTRPPRPGGLFLLSNTMTNHPERIYNWLDGQLSIARFAGSITINGATYVVATHEEGQPLVRQDVLAAEAKKKGNKQ